MPARILDEFALMKVSRQRRYQLRREAEGRCRICGEKGAPYCEKHREEQRRYCRKAETTPPAPAVVNPQDLI